MKLKEVTLTLKLSVQLYLEVANAAEAQGRCINCEIINQLKSASDNRSEEQAYFDKEIEKLIKQQANFLQDKW
jgi:hypothetical protein